MRLTVLHFNDVHGRLDALPRLATLIQRQRGRALAEGRTVLIGEGGDSSSTGQWESNATQGRANFALLEALGVQATVLGNADARWGRAALAKLVAAVHFPVLAANLVSAADETQLAVPGLHASTLLEFDTFKVGLLGATAHFPDIYEPMGYQTLDPVPLLRREAATLKAQGAHALILLSHLGYADDEALARALPELTLIVGGHSHTVLDEPMRVGETLIVQAGEHGRYLGCLDLDLAPTLTYTYQLLSTENIPPDPTISATLELVREEAGRLKQDK